MNGLLNLVTQLSQFLTGPFGVSLGIVALAGSWLAAACHIISPRSGWVALGCVAGAFSAAWLVSMVNA